MHRQVVEMYVVASSLNCLCAMRVVTMVLMSGLIQVLILRSERLSC
jgi:hypothetical protein